MTLFKKKNSTEKKNSTHNNRIALLPFSTQHKSTPPLPTSKKFPSHLIESTGCSPTFKCFRTHFKPNNQKQKKKQKKIHFTFRNSLSSPHFQHIFFTSQTLLNSLPPHKSHYVFLKQHFMCWPTVFDHSSITSNKSPEQYNIKCFNSWMSK